MPASRSRLFVIGRELAVFLGVAKDPARPSLAQPVLGDFLAQALMLVGLATAFVTGTLWWAPLLTLPYLAFRTLRYRAVRRAAAARRPPPRRIPRRR